MTQETAAFTLAVDQNPYLAVGSRAVHAIVRVTAADATADAPAAGQPPTAAEVVIIDKSSSMTGKKIIEACRAASAAVDAVRDGTYFAVIAGQSAAEQVYPAKGGMVRATARTRAAANRALGAVKAEGGTHMSTWLRLADRLLTGSPAELRHALMLTDGQNIEGDAPLRDALHACEGRFVCDCRGVGEDWSPNQLRQIARALRGGWKPVAAPEHLAEDFRAVMATSMRKRLAEVRLRVNLAPGARVVYFARVAPTIEDLSDKAVPFDGRVVEFPLGSWGDETQDFDLRIDVGQDDLKVENETKAGAGFLAVVIPAATGAATIAAKRAVLARWTTDIRKSAQINATVAAYTGQQELAEAVDAAIEAWDRERPDAAEKLGRAVALAFRDREKYSGLLEHLSGIAEFDDPAEGRVRPRPRSQVRREHVIWSTYLSEQSDQVVREDDADG
jgi:hypothetical protein